MTQHILAGLRALTAKKLREKGLTHEEIAKLLNVDRTVITHYLAGRIPAKEAVKCAKVTAEKFYPRDAVLFIKTVCDDNDIVTTITETLISDNIDVDVAISSKCNLCKICIDICPTKAITIENDLINIDKNKCCGCELCQELCQKNAIFLKIIKDNRGELD
ncbi:4Fe-4S binding protein [Methanococcus aeolicus]|uniref:4Fe-4S ferredoxin iron-sulfur binding domain protein n=1 Tax=Methanococcus aeolicus (strain ATCC BAA-1280 / DSM 17508 / OCM 812 / Nankai-3) TaxID=419665 RepID=A6UU90_META3|nr:4Fe-4S binding protein [Methanococcus aeolicus]ABR56062.1 4Fe-4S ferredoxin iron-sulfur binding domain protein [Methanococcus aeolicus Nankai-3]UXM85333.1 4Fe-4S binding protein [Methanococcus aeolicus]